MTNATPERIGDQPWAQRVRRWQDLKGVVCPAHGRDHPARLIPGIPDLLEIGPRLVCGVEVPARHMLASPEGRCRWDAEVPELVVDPQRHRQLFPKCDHAADLYFCECADFDDSHPSTVHERVSPHELVSRWQSDAGVMCPYHLAVGVAEGIPAFLRFVQSVRADDPPTLICPAELGRFAWCHWTVSVPPSVWALRARAEVSHFHVARHMPAEWLTTTPPQNRRKVLNLRLSSRLEAARWCDRQATGDDEPVECDVPDCTIRARDASSRSD